MNKKLSLFLGSVTTILVGTLAACDINVTIDDAVYSLVTEDFNNVVTYQSKIDFDGMYILRELSDGTQEKLTITSDMLTEAVDTSTVGVKQAVVAHGTHTFSFSYTVKYQVEFAVDDVVVDTQHVLSVEEIVQPSTPTKTGYEFISWSPEMPETLTDNMYFEAVFEEKVIVPTPELKGIKAEYGDRLSDVVLPSNEYGAWQFVEETSQTLDEIGTIQKQVQFLLKDGTVYEVNNVMVAVSKKTLQFVDVALQFEYDGMAKTPAYAFEGVNAEDIDVEFIPYYAGDAVSVGSYDFEWEIDDEHYQGYFEGTFVINKKKVNLSVVGTYQMCVGESMPTIMYAVTDENGEAVSEQIKTLLGVNVVTPTVNGAGEYVIDLEVSNTNFQVSTQTGILTVNKQTPDLTPQLIANTVAYGTPLSEVAFVNPTIGAWSWKNADGVIDTPNSFTGTVVFTPNEQNAGMYNSIEREATIAVTKKAVQITVTQNTYVYDGNAKSLQYTVEGVLSGDEDTYTVIGNVSELNAGTYSNIQLSIQSDRYYASVVSQLTIEKANIADFASLQEAFTQTLVLSDTSNVLSYVTLPVCEKGEWLWKDETASLEVGENRCAVKFIPSDTTNYNEEEGEVSLRVVYKGEIFAEDKTFAYNEQNNYPLGVTANHSESVLTYAYTKNGETVDGLTDAGEYVVTISLAQSESYTAQNVQINVVIERKAIDAPTQTESVVYNGKEQTSTFASTTEYTVQNVKGENVGTYYATVTLTDNYKWKDGTTDNKTLAFTITRKEITLPDPISVVYNGEEQTSTFANTEYYTVQNGKGTDLGTYDVTFTLKNENCKWKDSDELVKTAKLFIITNAVNEITFTIADSWTYGESSPALNATSKFGEVNYTLNGEAVTQLPNILDAGEYTVVATVQGDGDNYALVSVTKTFTVNKKKIDMPTLTTTSAVYDGERHGTNLADTDEYTVENVSEINVGTYDVVVTLRDTDNYEWKEVKTLTFTITQATNVITFNLQNWKYGTIPPALDASAKFGEVKYTFDGEEVTSLPENLSAGTYTITANVVADGDNYDAVSVQKTFTVQKATVSVVGPTYIEQEFDANTVDLSKVEYMSVLPTANNADANVNITDLGTFAYEIQLNSTNNHHVIEDGKVNVTVVFTLKDEHKANYVNESFSTTVKMQVRKVAYVQGGASYASIEGALKAVTSGEVWVTAGLLDVVIVRDCTVPSGVTLNIPHTTGTMNADGKAVLYNDGVDTDGDGIIDAGDGKGGHPNHLGFGNLNLQTNVTLTAEKTLTNNGTLKIAGELSGGGGGSSAGHTAGKYAKLTLGENAKLINTKDLYCYGMILEESDNNGSEVQHNSGNAYIPFVVRDFRGGTMMYATYKGKGKTVIAGQAFRWETYNIAPFNQFELRNVVANITIQSNASIYGYINLRANETFYNTTVGLMGASKDFMFQMASGATITAKYTIENRPETSETDTAAADKWQEGVMQFIFDGGLTINSLTLKMMGVEMNTKDCYFPFSWRQNYVFNNGAYTMSGKYKMLPGANVTVGNGATLSLGEMNIYKAGTNNANGEWTDTCTIGGVAYSYAYNRTCGNAVLTVQNGGALTASKVGGNVVVEEGGSASATTKGLTTYEAINHGGKLTFAYLSEVATITNDGFYINGTKQ